MRPARLHVDYAGPLTTVQDIGRFGFQRYGVTEGGPMDRTAFAIGQTALGLPRGGASIEVGLGGLKLRCLEGSLIVAITGGSFSVAIDGRPGPSWSVVRLYPDTELAITRGRWGNWCYVAVAGTINWPTWLGSRSTLSALSVTGQQLKEGDELVISDQQHLAEPRELTVPVFCQTRNTISLVVGPQERFFKDSTVESLFAHPYFITPNLNRMGVRLEGPKLPIAARLDMPSEGILRGSVQVQGSGDPWVLLADHQTTGGYPKIATLISADQDVFAQMQPRQPVQFRQVTVDHAVARARTRKRAVQEYVASIQRGLARNSSYVDKTTHARNRL
jgi:biotin-dependent carboxylase-like uncharacterized protein